MKANELRLGNWVNFMEDNTSFEVGEISLSGLVVKNDYETTWIELSEFVGIPLTPEILEKAGFIFYDNPNKTPSRIYKTGSDFRLCKWYNQDHFTLWDYPYGNSIKYLHQLQNLYFALTGEELEINL